MVFLLGFGFFLGLALAALALMVFGAIECPPFLASIPSLTAFSHLPPQNIPHKPCKDTCWV